MLVRVSTGMLYNNLCLGMRCHIIVEEYINTNPRWGDASPPILLTYEKWCGDGLTCSIHNQTKKCGKMVDYNEQTNSPKDIIDADEAFQFKKKRSLCTQMQASPQRQPKKKHY
jgi:hypothetical protein